MRKILIAALSLATFACASSREAMSVAFERPMVDEGGAPEEPPMLTKNPFATDNASTISDDDLILALNTPVQLKDGARVGVVPVQNAYAADGDAPLLGVPGVLRSALEDTGAFDAVTEVSTDFSRAPNIGGLRDLAARYRSQYLLLYRHRFVDRQFQNPHSWWWLTGVGLFVAPAHSLESAGVLEATLYDVRTGTILFTVYERIDGVEEHDPFDHDRKRRILKEKLLQDASARLSDRVTNHVLALKRDARVKELARVEAALIE